MANPRRSPTVRLTRAAMAADRGPDIAHYELPLDYPELYEWIPNSVLAADDLTVLSHNGGTAGRWRMVRTPIEGTALTNADETLTVGGNRLRRLPAATALTANRIKTLSTTNARAGDTLLVVREGLGAFTLAIANGGPGAGTLFTLPISVAAWAEAYFDGTNWTRMKQGQFA